ncbi:MAG: DUF4931 domain-containing protein [Elusimicrobiales bacterium]|nr:DUF4931 domain-containing protein [Elusimicrobiales bacterium]
MKPHLRKDIFSSCWVIINDERSKRPNDYVDSNIICPFCPGNEKQTPVAILERKRGNKWYIRVVENKYPALVENNNNVLEKEGIFFKYFFNGRHEVIIETPLHRENFYNIKHLSEIFEVYSFRMNYLYSLKNSKYVMLFKNYGVNAGASLKHPHSQIISLPIIPVRVEDEVKRFRYYFYKYRRCLMCDVIENEIMLKKRVFYIDDFFIVFAPFASRFNFEIWIAPLKHEKDFFNEENFNGLADIFRLVLKKLHRIFDDLSYNMIFHTAPKNVENFHWHIEILPKLAMPAGFEWGSGFYINSVSPEQAIKILKLGKKIN